MPYKELDIVVLVHDVPASGLRAGDVGTIVHPYGDAAFEVEFVRASGITAAVVQLGANSLRPAADHDQLAVRVSTGSGGEAR